MSPSGPVTLDAEERDAFLGDGGTGVLSFAAGDDSPYSRPVSYGYDANEATFYFRLAVDAEREKRPYLDRRVTFVVYGQADDGWHSVVATGRLEATTEPDIATETLAGLEQVRIPMVDIFGDPPGDVRFEFYRLAPDDLSGRRETRTGL